MNFKDAFLPQSPPDNHTGPYTVFFLTEANGEMDIVKCNSEHLDSLSATYDLAQEPFAKNTQLPILIPKA